MTTWWVACGSCICFDFSRHTIRWRWFICYDVRCSANWMRRFDTPEAHKIRFPLSVGFNDFKSTRTRSCVVTGCLLVNYSRLDVVTAVCCFAFVRSDWICDCRVISDSEFVTRYALVPCTHGLQYSRRFGRRTWYFAGYAEYVERNFDIVVIARKFTDLYPNIAYQAQSHF